MPNTELDPPSTQLVHVAVGLIVNANNEVLIALRHPDSHQGDLWEFPGGKVERDETVFEALDREFAEELGIRVDAAFPVRKITHSYSDKNVLLDVWYITEYSGQPQGCEGQPIRWCSIAQLRAADFPRANSPIIELLQLPDIIAITPEMTDPALFASCIAACARKGINKLQLRQKQMSVTEYLRYFELCQSLCESSGIQLVANVALEDLRLLASEAVHLPAKALMAAEKTSFGAHSEISASCHNLIELQQAERLGLDYVFLSPVAETVKYASKAPLGWLGFKELAAQVSLPVYALGGMNASLLAQARAAGAQGVAGISMLGLDNE